MSKTETPQFETPAPSEVGKLAWDEIKKLDEKLLGIPEFAKVTAREWLNDESETITLRTFKTALSDSVTFSKNGMIVSLRRSAHWTPGLFRKYAKGLWKMERKLIITPSNSEDIRGAVLLQSTFHRQANKEIDKFERGKLMTSEGYGTMQTNPHAVIERVPHILALIK